MPPSAARGILEAIHWKPAIRWVIDRIHVLKPIRFQSIRRNEVASKIPTATARSAMRAGDLTRLGLVVEGDRQQRAMVALREVAYVIEAHFELTPRAKADDTEAKHSEMFKRRAAKGQCFHQPCMGVREFPAHFALVDGGLPKSELPNDQRDLDLGWMLYDMDFSDASAPQPMFFRAGLCGGVLDAAAARQQGLTS
jgi:CRISPR-associated protein Cas5d